MGELDYDSPRSAAKRREIERARRDMEAKPVPTGTRGKQLRLWGGLSSIACVVVGGLGGALAASMEWEGLMWIMFGGVAIFGTCISMLVFAVGRAIQD